MEVFTMFLLKSAAWLTGFLLVYLLFLKNERFFAIKRYYLVAGILASFVFPLVSFHYSVVVTAPPVSQVLQVQDFQGRSLSTAESLNTGTVNYKLLAAGIYLMILLILITRLLKQLYFFRRMIRKGEVSCSGRARIVKIPGLKSSFSFFRYIFIGSSVDESEATHILNHEEVHVSQRHWFDLLLAEVVKTLQWINPFAWIYAVQIRQNHEFLADEAALKKISDPGSYRAVLLNHIFNAQVLPLSNSFSYSNNKKRFVMMDKITIPPYRKYKLLIMIPVAATIFYAFATPEYQYAAPANNSAITDIATSMQKTIPLVVTSAGDTIKEPLLVIDGVIQEKRVWIDPDNINTISVLKDESATAVFGDKGKNGVVIVTLKKPAGTVETREIRGSVVSGDGKALEGACIVINGTTVGTISDSRGAFRLTNVAPDALIVVTYVGYRPIPPIPVSSGEMKVTLHRDTVNLNSIAVPPPPPPPPAEGGEKPLYVVDGKIMDDIRTIDPDNIESINVLKGTSAVKKYGVKGKDGVIEVKTKPEEVSPVVDNVKPEVMVMVEEMPMFPGGEKALQKWIYGNIKMPAGVDRGSVREPVKVVFTVSETGKISGVRIKKSVHPLLDAEAKRVVESMPDWSPGKQNGKPVDVYYQLPINFNPVYIRGK